MLDWSTTQWAIVVLAFLAGLFLGGIFCTGRKWKRKYQEEAILRKEDVRRREELERAHKHHEAELIAAKARADKTPPRTTT
jgi:uncharacterized membrane-anchored protein YhcB (DUF1043 family)